MLPCKKRRTTVTESSQDQGNQEEEDLDLESAIKPSSDQVKDLGSASLSGGPSHGRVAGLQVESLQDASNQLCVEDPSLSSLSSRILTQDTSAPVLEAVDAAISQGITLPSLESSQLLHAHVGKGKVQAPGARRGKKIMLRPGPVSQENRGDHPITKEPFSGEPGEEVKEEGGKPQLHSGGAMPLLPLGSHSAKPGAQPGKSPQPDVCACPQEKPLGTLASQAEDETEDGGLFIPMDSMPSMEPSARLELMTLRSRPGLK